MSWRPGSLPGFSPDGKYFVTGSAADPTAIWDAKTKAMIRTLNDHPGTARSMSFSPDGKSLAIFSYAGTVKLWDVTSGMDRLTVP
jgi:WD40 repeat protein